MKTANGRLSRSVPILTTMSDGARRKSHQVCTIELALMPTYANFDIGGAIGDRDTSPSTVLDM
ncbi:hypothetical protein BZG77_06085 [Salinivibrio sp. IB643]|nr:hypothetical protein BZG77_06085 [Salinivibrio sp. IB643]